MEEHTNWFDSFSLSLWLFIWAADHHCISLSFIFPWNWLAPYDFSFQVSHIPRRSLLPAAFVLSYFLAQGAFLNQFWHYFTICHCRTRYIFPKNSIYVIWYKQPWEQDRAESVVKCFAEDQTVRTASPWDLKWGSLREFSVILSKPLLLWGLDEVKLRSFQILSLTSKVLWIELDSLVISYD